MTIEYHIRFWAVLWTAVLGCCTSLRAEQTAAALKTVCERATEASDHRAALTAAEKLLRSARRDGDAYHEAWGLYYAGMSQLLLGDVQEGMTRLHEAERLVQTIRNDTLVLSIYNAYGIYEANRNNYTLARNHFFKALDCAVDSKDRLRQAKVEINLAEVAYILKDTAGLRYALDAYEWAEAHGQREVMLVGAYQCANLLHLMQRPQEALQYLKIVDKLSAESGYTEQAAIHKLYADIYLQIGRYDRAVDLLDLALSKQDHAQAATLPEIYLSYARVRSAQGQYTESNRLIGRGLELALEKTAYAPIADLYRLESDNYEALGDTPRALQSFKAYKNICDSIYDVEKEHAVYELGMQYEIEKNEQQVAYQKQLLVQETKKTTFLLLASLCLLVLVGVLCYSYYRQRSLYKAIASQNKDALERERVLHKRLKEQASHVPATTPTDEKHSSGTLLSDERMDALYEQACDLMEEKRLYTDCNLTRERFAELLNTNRTYLSQVINKKAGLTYLQFVNQYRIKEAVRILSDAGNRDYPLKALHSDLGFSSPTTFYKLFQDTVGMTPSAYRKTILHL